MRGPGALKSLLTLKESRPKFKPQGLCSKLPLRQAIQGFTLRKGLPSSFLLALERLRRSSHPGYESTLLMERTLVPFPEPCLLRLDTRPKTVI